MTEEERKLKDKVFDEVSEAAYTGRIAKATERIHGFYKQANYVQLDPDPDLPISPVNELREPEVASGYDWGQEDMLKAGFKKVR